MDPNPQVFRQRAGVFTRAASQTGAAAVVATRDESGLAGWAVVPTGLNVESVGRHAGAAVGARAELEPAGLPELIGLTPYGGYLVAQRFSQAARDALVGSDPAELSRSLARMLPPGSWVAATFRQPSKIERGWWKRWLAHRLGVATPTDHSMGSEAVAMSVVAGGYSPEAVREVLLSLAASLPGFSQATHAVTLSARDVGGAQRRVSIGAGVASLLVAVLTWFGVLGPMLPAGAGPWLLPAAAVLLGGSIVAGVWSWLLASRRLGSWTAQVLDFGLSGEVPVPPHRLWPPRAPRKESTRVVKTANGDQVRQVAEFAGDYPLHDAVFLCGPEVFVGLVAPQAGVASGETQTALRQAPAAMMQSQIGPMFGDSADGPVFFSALDMRLGTAVTGGPGSGKTKLINALWGWSCADRMRPMSLAGFPGRNNTLIAFDSKGSETPRLVQWAQVAGDSAKVVDILDTSTPAIDLFGSMDSSQRGAFLTRAMQYGFDDGAIQGRSLEVLQAVVTGGLAVDAGVLAAAADLPGMSDVLTGELPNPIALAHWLCGGVGDEVAQSLFAAINAEATRRMSAPNASTADRVLLDAALQLRPFFSGVTPAARRASMEAARNKLKQLRPLDAWWSSERPRLSWSEILTSHTAVVLNFGKSATGEKPEDEAAKILSAMLFYALKQAISVTCDGWESENRWVSIFSDELALQAGDSPEVFAWLRDQGRSYGVRLFLATQRPGQLEQQVRLAFLTLATLVSFKQESVDAADDVAKQIALRPGEWTAEDILTLPIWTAAIRSQVGQVRQAAFTATVRNFEADMAATMRVWGYANEADAEGGPGGLPARHVPDAAEMAAWVAALDDDADAAAQL